MDRKERKAISDPVEKRETLESKELKGLREVSAKQELLGKKVSGDCLVPKEALENVELQVSPVTLDKKELKVLLA